MEVLAQPWLLGALCFVAGFLLARWVYRRERTPVAPPSADISDAAIEAELRAGRKVDAIRLCRQKYGYDLKKAADEINAISARLGLRV